MSDSAVCPVCRNTEGGSCQATPQVGDYTQFRCDICGQYAADGLVELTRLPYLKPIQRAILSHSLCMASRAGNPLTITSDWLSYLLENSTLPNPVVQTANMVRYIGDEVSRSGSAIEQLPVDFHAIIGAPSREFAQELIGELNAVQIVKIKRMSIGNPSSFRGITLTIDGWERYEAERRGEFQGNYGFIAMQFGDLELDPFVKDVVKPAVKEGIGYDLVDMRDVGRTGVIDNIMRTQIRDAAFVIVDLTHDNSGAYWEAGYAEGLGKPVLYICEKTKFDEKKTHFDTNHCLTIPWSRDDDKGFKQELIATLRRSLNL